MHVVQAKQHSNCNILHISHSGESGLGKSTLVNTLFKSKISRTACTPGPHAIPSTTEVNSVSHG